MFFQVVGKNAHDVGKRTHAHDVLLAFLKMEEWLGYRVNSQRPIHVYVPFNGTYNLLFKDSTSGLVPTSFTQKTVEAYKDLFSHVLQCSTGHLTAAANYIFVALVALYHIFPSHIQYQPCSLTRISVMYHVDVHGYRVLTYFSHCAYQMSISFRVVDDGR